MSVADKLTTVAENQQKVYDAGKSKEWNDFWDSFQNNGNRTNYYCAFAQQSSTGGWTDVTFKPKYDIKPTGNAQQLFRGAMIGDLVKILNDNNVSLDLSGATTIQYVFYSMSNVTHIPEVNGKNATFFQDNFGYNTNLKTIDKIIMPNSSTVNTVLHFIGCPALENIVFEGVIYKSMKLQDCKKLTKTSIISVINALSSTATGQTVNFSKTAINAAFGINVDDESTFPEGSEYYTLRNSKSNWTFSYSA